MQEIIKMKTRILIILGILILISLVFAGSVSAVIIESVSTMPSEIAPGETSIIKLGIQNNGEEDIKDVTVSLVLGGIVESDTSGNSIVFDLPFAPYNSASEFNIDEIKDGRVKYAEFEVVALNDAESGIYKIPVQITYEEKGTTKTKNSLISLSVNSEPIIGVDVESGLLLKGQENEITVEIVNKGLSNIKFLEVELGRSTYYALLSQKNIYIGDIDSDDFDSTEFKILFNENAPSTVNLPVSITYKDALNNEYTEDFILPLRVYTREKAIELGLLEKNNTTTYVIVVIVLIILYIIYRKFRKRRKLKKASS